MPVVQRLQARTTWRAVLLPGSRWTKPGNGYGVCGVAVTCTGTVGSLVHCAERFSSMTKRTCEG
jgi:hypothetical protein